MSSLFKDVDLEIIHISGDWIGSLLGFFELFFFFASVFCFCFLLFVVFFPELNQIQLC